LILERFKVPLTWGELLKRTFSEVLTDNCFGLAAELAYYFFLALFPALLFLAAIISFIPIANFFDLITSTLAKLAPIEVLTIVQDQILKIAHEKNGGLLTLGMIGTIWSTSSGVSAIISTLNQAYDVQESRPWWRVQLISLALTIALAVFIVSSFALVLVGPTLAEHLAARLYLGSAFEWTWKILQWPTIFALVSFGIAIVYYYAPDVEQQWIWITPGSVLATILWMLISLGFKLYVAHFSSYNATYGTIGGVIVALTWFYVSSFAILIGAELNAEIEHASPYGKDPGERVPGEKEKLAAIAEEARAEGHAAGTLKPAIATQNCDIDADLLQTAQPYQGSPRLSDWILTGVITAKTVALAYAKLRSRFKRLRV
jgi:membrane protein